MCKSFERVFSPVVVHSVKNAKEDAFTAVACGEGAHGADAPSYFDKEPFDHVGGAETFPMCLRTVVKGQQFF